MEDFRVLLKRSEVPPCTECEAYEENPWNFAATKICPECPWGIDVRNPLLDQLLHYLNLIDSGCPVSRYELSDEKWIMLGRLRTEREKTQAERMREDHGQTE